METNFELEIWRGLKAFERQRQSERIKKYEVENNIVAVAQQAKKDEISELVGAMAIIKEFFERHKAGEVIV